MNNYLQALAPAVRETILAAAAAGCGLADADPRAMTHSWLFTGPPGSGRSHAALAFAAGLMCPEAPGIGCGHCEACHDILDTQTHTDLVFRQPKELSIGVDAVREIISRAASRPTVAPWRVVIFDNADRLTNEAANALLKTVEEPSARTALVLCAPSSAPEDFSQTLRSRCRLLYVPSPSVDEIVRQLVGEGASESAARLAAVTSLRHVGRARRLVTDQETQQRRAQAINIAEAVFGGAGGFQAVNSLVTAVTKQAKAENKAGLEAETENLQAAYGVGAKGKGAAKATSDVKSAVKSLEETYKKRETRLVRDLLDLALVDLAGVYRDAIMVQSAATVELTHPDFEGLSKELAAKVDEAGLLAALDAINLCRERINQNVPPATAFDGLMGRLRLACEAR